MKELLESSTAQPLQHSALGVDNIISEIGLSERSSFLNNTDFEMCRDMSSLTSVRIQELEKRINDEKA